MREASDYQLALLRGVCLSNEEREALDTVVVELLWSREMLARMAALIDKAQTAIAGGCDA
jgi:hypothetical protein